MKQLAFVGLVFASVAGAQSTIPVREIGKLERVSSPPFQSVSTVLPLRDGRVLVNDGRARRLVVLDSTLTNEIVVKDTMGTTNDAYARGSAEALFPFRGDSALIVNISTQVGLVISPTGKVIRAFAFPPPPGHPEGQQVAIGGRGGRAGIDARGRLLYFYTTAQTGMGMTTLSVGMKMDSTGLEGMPILRRVFSVDKDSGALLRVDLATRKFDTAAVLKTPLWKTKFKTDDDKGLIQIETTPDLFPMVDDFAILPDGSVAVVRGRDYHIDWVGTDGRETSTPKMPFAWQRLSDSVKNAAADSIVKFMQDQYDRSSGRGGSPRSGGLHVAPNVAVRPAPNDMPDYVPAFDRGDVRADADGNVWIRTSTTIKDRPVYDIVNRKGEIVDRVQLPAFRVISGFAPGVVFMAVTDNTNVVRLERARIR